MNKQLICINNFSCLHPELYLCYFLLVFCIVLFCIVVHQENTELFVNSCIYFIWSSVSELGAGAGDQLRSAPAELQIC